MDNTFLNDRVSVFLFPIIIIITVTYYRTFVFGEKFDENEQFVQHYDGDCNKDAAIIASNKDAANWNWTLYAVHVSFSDHETIPWETSDEATNEIDLNLILEDVRSNFIADKYKNVRENLRFTENADNIACPMMISNATGDSFFTKVAAYPDAIGIGFAKSGTGSLAMLRLVSTLKFVDY